MRHPLVVAAAWMAGALLSFSAMAVAVRELSANFGTFQLLAIRSLIGLLVISAILTRAGWAQVSFRNVRLHFGRNFVHFCGQFGWFYAIALIPLAAVFAIEFTVPLWTVVFAAFLLGERISATRGLAVVLGISGVLVILRPGWSVVHPAALVMLAGAFAYGLSHTLTKRLAGLDTPLCILFYMMLVQLPLGLVPAVFNWATRAAAHWPLLIVVGIAGLSAHYCMVRAFSLADASVVVPLDFLRLPLIALVGYALYSERVDEFLVLGAGLILAGNFINLYWERKKKQPLQPARSIPHPLRLR
ncbi:DMT family transporter [Methylomicrobium album]|uniref:Putative membrane protein n=1 Tax=Methylomicrobium album BG8 TaxID=686340 RepID=H8GHA7_METAL|nr:DMT family transporter [Methylomicrobium album]EIC28898.1 putative membrane protein [Methylomicrobium album BG8]